MARYTGPYQGARSCTSGPQPGAWGQMDWFLSNFADLGGVNSGIYNCRNVRGGRTTSLHGEGRAADNGIRPYSAEYGTKLANAIVHYSKELGVQCVIWNRMIWSCKYPSIWRKYTGAAHHEDHLHVEFTWASAKRDRKAQRELWAKVLGGSDNIGGNGSVDQYGDPKAHHELGSRTLDLYDAGTDVKDVQERLKKLRRYTDGKADGYYGPMLKRAVTQYQRSRGLTADGIAGPVTIKALISGKKKVTPGGKPTPKDPKSPPKPSPTKPAPSSKAPPFPLPTGHWYGVESSDPRNHSGYWEKDRAGIRALQQRLKDRSWKVTVDGKYGAKTKAVVSAFQKKAGLRVDGGVGVDTWTALFTKPLMKK